MRKTNLFGSMVWVGLIWLTFEAFVGRLLAVQTERLFSVALVALSRLNRLP